MTRSASPCHPGTLACQGRLAPCRNTEAGSPESLAECYVEARFAPIDGASVHNIRSTKRRSIATHTSRTGAQPRTARNALAVVEPLVLAYLAHTHHSG